MIATPPVSAQRILSKAMLDAFENASAFIAVLRGPSHIYELANAQYRRLMGDRAYVGRPVREVAPDVRDQGFFEILDRVLASGQSYVARNVPLVITRMTGPRERFRVNLLYSAIADPRGGNYGVFVEGNVISGLSNGAAETSYDSLLTKREVEIVYWSAQGKAAQDTGLILGIAPKTVAQHMSRVMTKIRADNYNHAAALAIQRRII